MPKKGSISKLIQSLNKAEKRYFKLEIGKSDKNYLSLFNFLEAHKDTDDTELKKHFSKEKFAKQLHVTKNYLSRIILRTLKNFHHQKNSEQVLLNLLQENELLLSKELYDLAEQNINKTIALAEKHEKLALLLEALNQKRTLIMESTGLPTGKKPLNEIIDEQNQILKLIFNQNEYHHLNTNFYDFFQVSGGLNRSVYTSLSKNPLIINPENALTTEAKNIYHNLLFAYHIYKDNNYTAAYQSLEQLSRLFERSPAFLTENASAYFATINNQISTLLHIRNFTEIPALLEKIRTAPDKYPIALDRKTEKQILQSWIFELELYRDLNHFEQGLKLMPKIMSLLEDLSKIAAQDFIPQFDFIFAVLQFYSNQKDTAKTSLEKLLSHKQADDKHDLMVTASFLLLMINYSLEKFSILSKLGLKCKNLIKTKHRPKDFQKCLLDFFMNFKEKDQKNHINTLKKNLKQFADNNEYSTFAQTLLLDKWLEEITPVI